MSAQKRNIIWHAAPASQWEETHPIGNGSLGAMIWGTVETEKIGLNIDTLWSGYKRDTNNHSAKEYLDTVRSEIFAGNYHKASQLVEEHLLGEFGENYLPFGNLYISMGKTDGDVSRYERKLDISKAIETISYQIDGICYSREYFASYPDRLIAASYSFTKRQNIEITFESQLATHISFDKADGFCISGQCPEHVDPSYLESDDPVIQGNRGMTFKAYIKVLDSDGLVEYDGKKIIIKCASYVKLCFTQRESSIDKSYEEIKKTHISDYRTLFDRVDISLGNPSELPTDKRLENLKNDMEDNDLYALFFQYGRYLLISSSREGSQAANLQGIWNWQIRAPWSANYTTNINVEMNYWHAWVCNLPECLEPYYRLLEELVDNGKRTAQIHFGCRGFCVGHNTDYWRITNPVGVRYGGCMENQRAEKGSSLYAFFVLSGQWMCQELWKNYEYCKDINFLYGFSYPILKEAVLFVIDFLVEYKGYYVTCPSASPENSFETDEGVSSISMGSTMDMTIVREIFKSFENICRKLKEYGMLSGDELSEADGILQEVAERKSKLPPYKIGSDGRLLEWFYNFKETEPGHRHISHAYGLFPGNEFRGDDTLKEACRKTIEYRLSHGGGRTGWSCAWIANLYAVLGDADKAFEYMKILLSRSICPNLWTSHPPFQIDANFAGTMAIAQMLVQDDENGLKILPAKPKSWERGFVKGLRITAGRTIDIKWNNDKYEYKIHKAAYNNGHQSYQSLGKE